MKTLSGRGLRQQDWVTWLYPQLLEEFERLRAAGVKFSKRLIGVLAEDILNNSEDDMFNANTRNKRGVKIVEALRNASWVDQFCLKHRIVVRRQTGKLQLSSEKEVYISKSVAFENGILDENYIGNMDETHFVFNMDNGTTLGFTGDKIKYADVSSGIFKTRPGEKPTRRYNQK